MTFSKAMRMTLLAALISGAGMAQAEVVVIVNPKNAVSTLSAEQVANVFLGKSNTVPGGGNVVPVDGPEAAAWREEFYSKVTGKSAAQVKAIWSRLVFTGKGQPPREFGSSADVKKYVAATPDAIGYIEKSAVDASVKVVLGGQ